MIGKLRAKGGDIPVAAMQGRVHFYEGYPLSEVIFPMRVFARMGIRAVILTNAAGGINRNYGQGALVVLSDHINLQGSNPLIGANDERFGPRFPDMTHAYNRNFRKARARRGRQARNGDSRRRVRRAYRAELRIARGNSLPCDDWRGFGGHVHSSGSDRGAAHGNANAWEFPA